MLLGFPQIMQLRMYVCMYVGMYVCMFNVLGTNSGPTDRVLFMQVQSVQILTLRGNFPRRKFYKTVPDKTTTCNYRCSYCIAGSHAGFGLRAYMKDAAGTQVTYMY